MGAETNTDVLQIEVNTLFSRYQQPSDSERIARTFGHAMRLAGAAILEVDTREISVVAARMAGDPWGVHLFDTAAGGSGHIASLLEDQNAWFTGAMDLIRGNEGPDRKCREACLMCLLDAQSQALYPRIKAKPPEEWRDRSVSGELDDEDLMRRLWAIAEYDRYRGGLERSQVAAGRMWRVGGRSEMTLTPLDRGGNLLAMWGNTHQAALPLKII